MSFTISLTISEVVIFFSSPFSSRTAGLAAAATGLAAGATG
jgi:hypothetical protein